jgi:hypothetical protein
MNQELICKNTRKTVLLSGIDPFCDLICSYIVILDKSTRKKKDEISILSNDVYSMDSNKLWVYVFGRS